MESLWTKTSDLPDFPALQEDIQTDVLIIGGGITGILCAYLLKQPGVSCVLAEADRICSGITKNTTAKITAQHGLIYDKITRKYGLEKAQMYLSANLDALETYRSLCAGISCNFTPQDAYVYSTTGSAPLEQELEALVKLHYPAEMAVGLDLPFPTAGAVKFPDQAQFHPLKFLSAIAKDLPIYEHTTIRQLIGSTALTDTHRIKARKIIVATHFPFLNKHGLYFLKQYQHRSYVLALENARPVNGMFLDQASDGLSFRNWGDLLLLGGGSHRTGKPGGNWEVLEEFAHIHYPGASIRYRWATQDCMTLDGIPYIGNYSRNTPDLYVATGFNKWGMTSAMAAAKILTNLVQDKDDPCAPVFSPSRSMFHPQLALNAWEATVNLLTPTPKRCPHMGCALKWNPQEHSWDCPCHGSRFTFQGKLIDNPAAGDLKNRG